MPTIEHSWKENRRGKTVTVSNKTVSGCENPWVGMQLNNFRTKADEEVEASWYVLAYLIQEYGDDALEEVKAMDQESREEYVKEIEDRLHEKRQQHSIPSVLMRGE